jgi:hypothetical protein
MIFVGKDKTGEVVPKKQYNQHYVMLVALPRL